MSSVRTTRFGRALGDAERLSTPYELIVRSLIPSRVVANELPEKLASALRDAAAAVLVRFKVDGEQQIAWMAELLLGHLVDQHSDEFGQDAVRIAADDLRDVGISEAAKVELDSLVSQWLDANELAERWTRELTDARTDAIGDLVLVDKRSSTPVSHSDVGIGVSQVLPVLVSAFAFRNQLVAIEQPEIHLPPALQAELGDVFIESALGEQKNTFLLETHSEHLLLRIMRRMRETSSRTLPEGVRGVYPDDVMVLFVEADGSQSIIREMPLNERGELVKPWPGGFFEEGLREVF